MLAVASALLFQTPAAGSRSRAQLAAERILRKSDALQIGRRVEHLRVALPKGIPVHARLRALARLAAEPPARLELNPGAQWWFLGPQPISDGEGIGADAYCDPPSRIEVSGRVSAIAFGASPSIVYLGAADGGIWKSVDGARTFVPLTDHQASLAIGSLAVIPGAKTDADVIYAGTGEANGSCDSEYGVGILKSVDGGQNWQLLGADVFDRLSIGALAVWPSGGPDGKDIVYAAARPAAINGSAEECFPAGGLSPALFKSTDGGSAWRMLSGNGGLPAATLEAGSPTGVIIDPQSPQTVYAGIAGDAPTGGLYKSTDGGTSWSALGSFPAGATRIALAISLDGAVLYAARAPGPNSFDAVYRSTDGGQSFIQGGELPTLGGCLQEGQEFYNLTLLADGADASDSTLYLGLTALYKSTDGGQSFSYTGAGTHVDFHALASNSGLILSGSDGGLFASSDGGATWDASPNDSLGITQFQAIAASGAPSPTLIGGTQDNGTDIFSSGTLWRHGDDGDGGFVAIDQAAPSTLFDQQVSVAGAPSLNISTNGGLLYSFVPIAPETSDPLQPYAPFREDPRNPGRILFGTDRVWESCVTSPKLRCNGASGNTPHWSAISGDLTGGCITGLCEITDIEIAPGDSDVIYVATGSNGTIGPKLWMSSDSASERPRFTEIDAGLPRGVPITSVAVSPLDPATLLVSVSGFSGGGRHLFLSSDSGSSWSDISGTESGFPNIPANKAIFDQNAPPSTFYAATDVGVLVTTDAGASWEPLAPQSLPLAPVYDLAENHNVLYAATHGRGVWALNAGPNPAPSATPTPVPSPTPTASASPSASPTPLAVKLKIKPLHLRFRGRLLANSSFVGNMRTVTVINPRGRRAQVVNISGVIASGAFEVASDQCAGTLDRGASCRVTIKLLPGVPGTQTGRLQIFDNAANSPQQVTLTAVVRRAVKKSGKPRDVAATAP